MPTGTVSRSSSLRSGPSYAQKAAVAKARSNSNSPLAMGRYQLTKFLGEGSNAQVYLAHDIYENSRQVVVKRIKEHVTQNPKFQQFFAAELISMANFVHPYSVRLLDASIDDPLGPVLVLEYIRGETLEDAMNRSGRLDLNRVGRVLAPLCHALHAAHKVGIIHRDLKPANLMVTNVGLTNESLKVMDFGFASLSVRPHIQLSEITGHGSVFAVGTPAYVSPEMIRGDAVDGRGDLYGVGVMLFEMLTGRLPFDHPTVDEILAAHVKDQPPRFHRINAGHISAPVEAVVLNALSKYPNERYATAKELCLAFEQASGCRYWDSTQPSLSVLNTPPPPDSVIKIVVSTDQHSQPSNSPLTDQFTLHDQFEAILSERLAAAKLRGFAADVGGEVLESEPGLIRMILGAPPKKSRSAIMNWIQTIRGNCVEKGKEPIEVTLAFERQDPTRVIVQACFTPMEDYIPVDQKLWRSRCESVYDILRQYLMASDSKPHN